MNAPRLTCNCGHRLALHTYFKDLTPCTVCRCKSFANETLLGDIPPAPKPSRRPASYVATERAEAERRPN